MGEDKSSICTIFLFSCGRTLTSEISLLEKRSTSIPLVEILAMGRKLKGFYRELPPVSDSADSDPLQPLLFFRVGELGQPNPVLEQAFDKRL